MKAVLISIQPKWVEKIASGKKTIEVRKTRPKVGTPFKCYIYCTIGKPTFEQSAFCDEISNGKVVGEFVCDSFYGITNFLPYDGEDCHHSVTQGVLEQTCLEDYEIDEYLGKKDGYGWHISQLKIYDKPKQLSVTERTVYSWIKDKKIIANKIGNKWQFTQEEIDYIKKNGLRNATENP